MDEKINLGDQVYFQSIDIPCTLVRIPDAGFLTADVVYYNCQDGKITRLDNIQVGSLKKMKDAKRDGMIG